MTGYHKNLTTESPLRLDPSVFSHVLENLNEAFIILDFELKILVANAAYRKLVQTPEVDFHELPLHSQFVIDKFKKSLVFSKEYIIEDYNVELRSWLEYHISPHPLGLGVFLYDITNKKAIELEVALQNEQSSLLLEGIDCGVARLGLNGRWLSLNSQCEKITGYSTEKLSKTYFWDLFVGNDTELDKEDLTLLLKEKKNSVISERKLLKANGDQIWVSTKLTLVRSADGKPKFFAVVIDDISERKLAEENLQASLKNATKELQLAKLAAEDATREKSYFLANMSHEIRTPLGAILGFTDMLKDGELSCADREEYLQIVSTSGKSLATLIDHILDLSKVDAGYLEIEKEPVNVMVLLEEIRILLQPKADAKALEFKFETKNAMNCRVLTDPIRLRQILLNVIGNAIKFTDSGFVRVTTQFVPKTESQCNILFSVEDSGVGLSHEESEKLFQPFTQADSSTTRKFSGTGLGLALSRRLAHALDGDLLLEQTEKGKGSIFTVKIEAEYHIDTNDLVTPGPELHSQEAEEVKLEGVKVLVADDSPENQRLFKHLLLKAGAEVDLADNGAKAVQMIDSSPYDIVLMDMQMPELDGYEATQELRRRGYKVPIVALTAHAMRHDREKCLKSGCSEYISKPVDPLKLFKVVDYFVNAPS